MRILLFTLSIFVLSGNLQAAVPDSLFKLFSNNEGVILLKGQTSAGKTCSVLLQKVILPENETFFNATLTVDKPHIFFNESDDKTIIEFNIYQHEEEGLPLLTKMDISNKSQMVFDSVLELEETSVLKKIEINFKRNKSIKSVRIASKTVKGNRIEQIMDGMKTGLIGQLFYGDRADETCYIE